MKILSGINTKMTQDANITALVSDRIYPMTMPDPKTSAPNTYPAIVYQLVSEAVQTSFDAMTVHVARVQIDVYAESMKDALQVDAALFTALHSYRGMMGEAITGFCMRDAIRTEHNADAGYYRVSSDYMIGYK